MAVDPLTERENGQTIDETWFSKIKKAFAGVISPRNSSTLASESGAASLGQASYPWKRANITSGYLVPGMVKFKYRYTGVSGLLEAGWMACDGRQITEAAYELEHGAGAYAAHGIASSPLLNKYLPNFDEKYIRGAASATQSGSSAITTIGSTGASQSHNHIGSGTTSSTLQGNPFPGEIRNAFIGSIVSTADASHNHAYGFNASNIATSHFPQGIKLNMYLRVI